MRGHLLLFCYCFWAPWYSIDNTPLEGTRMRPRAGQNGPFSVFFRYNGGFAPTGSVLLFAENGVRLAAYVFARRVCAAMAWHFRF